MPARRRMGEALGRAAMGERLEGFIYGTIVALAVLVAGARAFPHEAGHIAALVVATTIVFWLAHVYAHGLGRSVARDRRLTLAELRDVARHEWAIVEAAMLPALPLLLAAFGLISTRFAVWLALGTGLAVLAAEGLLFARVERLGWMGTLAVVSINLALGASLIVLKLVVTH
ncbi:MAG: hypothetical protein E6G26_04065 [Actinobacteria bacterium]|nr:MAG: hypothetical protein E6G26_04065 [Actinomycetota bacterium]